MLKKQFTFRQITGLLIKRPRLPLSRIAEVFNRAAHDRSRLDAG